MQKNQPLISLILLCGNRQRDFVEALNVLDAWGVTQKMSYEILVIPFRMDVRTRESLVRYVAMIPHARIVEYKTTHEGTLAQQSLMQANGLIRLWISDTSYVSCVTAYKEIENSFREGSDIVIIQASAKTKKQDSCSYLTTVKGWCVSKIIPLNPCVAYSQKSVYKIFPHTRVKSRGIIMESFVYAKKINLKISTILYQGFHFIPKLSYSDIRDTLFLSVRKWITGIREKMYSKKSPKSL